MAQKRLQLDYRGKGPWANDERWTSLVFDAEAKDIWVEEGWDNVDPPTQQTISRGSKRIELSDFLKNGTGNAHAELIAALTRMYEKQP
jgi:hypothetical protein